MRLTIKYLTCFSYPEAVRESHNVLRACPATEARQELLSYRVSPTPAARVFSYVDYWGTRNFLLQVAAGSLKDTSPYPMSSASIMTMLGR